MKKTIKWIPLLLCLVILSVSFTGCIRGEAGLSAYEIAVNNGFVGDEAAWLASLNGKNVDVDALYEAAVQEGYTGTLYEYLTENLNVNGEKLLASLDKELGLDTSNRITHSLLASVAVVSKFGSGFVATGAKGGSGVIYELDKGKGNAYIITNQHVVEHEGAISESITVYLYGSEYDSLGIEATYLGGSERYDIAVLEITNSSVLKRSNATKTVPYNSNLVTVGNTAIAIGNASDEGISVTSGVVSVESEIIELASETYLPYIEQRVMRIDTAVNEGNSGGGLFNKNGELIGIVNAKPSIDPESETALEGIAYAIPSNIAIGVAQNIIDNCENSDWEKHPVVATLGATLKVTDSIAYLDSETNTVRIKETVGVKSVTIGSAASKGGMRSGDILLSYRVGEGEDILIDHTYTLIDAILTFRVGDIVTISVERDGVQKDITITLTANMFSERP